MPASGIAALQQASNTQWGNFLAAVPDTVIVSNDDGVIVYANPAVESVLGYRADELIGEPVEVLVPMVLHSEHRSHRVDYHASPGRRAMGFGSDLRAVHRDGREIAVAISLGFTQTPAGKFVISTIQDLTELRLRDRAIIDELNARIAHNSEVSQLNMELEAFSYSVSHDLRAPLRVIDGFSHVLEEDYSDRLDVYGRDCVQRIRRSAQRMGALIDDLLKLSRITRADMVARDVDVSAMVRGIAENLIAEDPARQIELKISDGLWASGDNSLLRIAFENLMSNAFKFTTSRSPARIEVGQTECDGSAAIYVRDNGAGFDMSYAGKLFGAFQRLDNAKEFPGTGIGLATVQRVINRHGGKVWAEAEPDRGATFYLTLFGGAEYG